MHRTACIALHASHCMHRTTCIALHASHCMHRTACVALHASHCMHRTACIVLYAPHCMHRTLVYTHVCTHVDTGADRSYHRRCTRRPRLQAAVSRPYEHVARCMLHVACMLHAVWRRVDHKNMPTVDPEDVFLHKHFVENWVKVCPIYIAALHVACCRLHDVCCMVQHAMLNVAACMFSVAWCMLHACFMSHVAHVHGACMLRACVREGDGLRSAEHGAAEGRPRPQRP